MKSQWIRHLVASALFLSVATAGSAALPPASNRTVTVEASSSVENWGWYTRSAVDGERNSAGNAYGWSSQMGIAQDHTEWFMIDLGATCRFNRVDLYPRNDSGQTGNHFPVDFTIQVSTDKTNWSTVVTRKDHPKPDNAVQSFAFAETEARFIKVEATKLRPGADGKYLMQLAELEVYHIGETTPKPTAATNLARPSHGNALLPPSIRLSPRPAQPVVLDLGGRWLHTAKPAADFAQRDVAGSNGWTAIEIPRPLPPPPGTERFGYQRKIEIPADWIGQRVKFRCDSAEGLAEVWINGQSIGQHDGSWAMFELDATAAVRPGQDNLVSIQVTPSILGSLTKDRQGGIRRKLYLLALPAVHLAGWQVRTTFDQQYRDAVLDLHLEVANESDAPVAATLRWRLEDAAGEPVALPSAEQAMSPIGAHQTTAVEVSLPVSAPRQWHPEHPNLYQLTIEVVRDGKVSATYRQRIGFRQVEVKGDKLLLNGQPIKLRGAMLTYWHNATGWGGLTDAQRRKLLNYWREMNMNSCYPNPTPDEELLDLCDELGLAVICMARQHDSTASAENAPLFVRQAADLVTNHRNHPSVLIWTMGNESKWGPAFEAMAATYKKLDPTRPYMLPGSYTPPKHVPIASAHYPGVLWKEGQAPEFVNAYSVGKGYSAGSRPTIFTEYAHVSKDRNPSLRDFWHHELDPIWQAVHASQSTAGAMIFCGTDCVGQLWGLVDDWHRPKPEFWHARKILAPVRVVTNTVANGNRRVTLENRYDVTNLKDVRIEWTAGQQRGTASAEVPPHGRGEIEIPDGPEVTLTFTDPHGRLVDSIRFASEATAPPAPVLGRPSLKQTDTALIVTVGNIEWTFDAKTGLLTGAHRAGAASIVGGPFLHVDAPRGDWRPAKVAAQETPQGIEIVAEGAYDMAKGAYTMVVDNTGALTVRYDFAHTGAKTVKIRETGLAFDVTRTCDTLSWKRRGPWTDYPADHIGRLAGTAPAFRDPALKAAKDVEPAWPWSQDQRDIGTEDFTSTKYNILRASLRGKNGTGVTVCSDGQQAVRAAASKAAMRLHVLDFAGTGKVEFWKAGIRIQDLPANGRLAGAVRLELE